DRTAIPGRAPSRRSGRAAGDRSRTGPCDDARVPSPPTLETSRLRLRPLELSDAPELNRIQADAEHMRFYPHPFSLQETAAWIDRMRTRYDEDGFGLLAVEDGATGEFLGQRGPAR